MLSMMSSPIDAQIRILGINIFTGCGGAPYDKCRAEVQAAQDYLDAGGLPAEDIVHESNRNCKQERRECRRNA